MKTIQQFKDETDQLPSTDLLKKVEYYRKNGDLIYAIDEFLDKGHYNAKTKLMSDFGMALVDNHNYEEAYPILIKALTLMKDDPHESIRQEKITESTFYQHLLFSFGVATYYTKRMLESKNAFVELVALDPGNYNYGKWLEAIRILPLNKSSNVIAWIFTVIVVVKFVLPKDITNNFLTIYYPTILLLALAYLVVQLLKWDIGKKLKRAFVQNKS
jgi:tetratricopeptide (TPR) repeat protein